MKSLVSYPDRGPWGDPNFRGNCSGYLIEDLILQFKPHIMVDPTRGGGTTKDVCDDMGVTCWSEDLWTGFDIFNDEIPVGADLLFWHPPYKDIIVYRTGHKNELSLIPDTASFFERLNEASYLLYSQLRSGGFFATLVGCVRKSGTFIDMAKSMNWYGQPYATVIKEQHNVRSADTKYVSSTIWIVHETLIITKKPDMFSVPIMKLKRCNLDQRNLKQVPWRTVVVAVMLELKDATVQEVYEKAKEWAKTTDAIFRGVDWQATIRRTLQESKDLENYFHGHWRLKEMEDIVL